MFTLSRTPFLKFAAASALVALSFAGTPARADELAVNLGPVGPHEPILTTVGSKHVVAFYVPDSGKCALDAVVWEDEEAKTAARVRISLMPGEIAHIDSAEQKTLNLQCGDHAKTLAAVDNRELASLSTAQ
jgi:hypothetical protein